MTKDQTKQLREQYQKTNSVNPYLLQNLLDDWERMRAALEKIVVIGTKDQSKEQPGACMYYTPECRVAQQALHPRVNEHPWREEMIEIGTAFFDRFVPWSNTDEEYSDLVYIRQQLYAQMMGWTDE